MATSVRTVDDLIKRYGLDQGVLSMQCSDDFILDLALLLKSCNWESVALLLKVQPNEVKRCGSLDPLVLWNELLQLWLQKNAFDATFSWLLSALLKAGLSNSACKVCDFLKKNPDAQVISSPSSESLVKSKVTKDPLTIPKKHRSSSTGSGASSASTPPSSSSYQRQLSSSLGGATPSAQVAGEDVIIEEPTGYSLNKTREDLYKQFIALLDEVQEYIVSHEFRLEYITLFLTSPPHHLRQDLAVFMKSQEKLQLSRIRSVKELFIFLGNYWDEMNPALLVYLVGRLEDEVLIDKLRAYQEDLKQYNDMTPINRAPEFARERANQGEQNIIVQLPEERNLFLSYVPSFIDCFKRVTGCCGPVLYRGNQYSSICIVISIPCPLAKEVFHRKEVQEFLKEKHILRVHIDDECVFENVLLTSQHSGDYLAQLAESESSMQEESSSPLKRTHEMEEQEVLSLLRMKPSRASQGGAREHSFFLPRAGCRLYPGKEYFIIISDGSAHPDDIKLARRQVDEAYMRRLSKKYGNRAWNIPGLSEHAALDLEIIARKIALSEQKELTALRCDVAGKERSKEYYLQAIERFLRDCKRPGAYIWFMGHSEENTGNWCFKDGTMSFKEIFTIYKQVQEEKGLSLDAATATEGVCLLDVFSDCSYSGNWVHRCAKILDDEKIPPCGHQTSKRALKIRVHCSAKKNQQARALYFSEKGIFANKKDGEFSYQDIPLSQSQHPFSGDFTKLVCLREENEECRMDEDIRDWTWSDVVSGKLRKSFYIIHGSQKGRKRWYIILLFNKDSAKFVKQYEAEVKREELHTAKWGYILKSGHGEKPSDNILRKVTQWTYV